MRTHVDTVVETIDEAVKNTEKFVEPIRKTGFKRFPSLFMLLTTFGVTATFLGMERIITDIAWLDAHPLAILALGILALVLTGRLYKKLD